MKKNITESDIKFIDIFDTNKNTQEKVRGWRNKPEIRKCMITQHIVSKREHSSWLKMMKDNKQNKIWVVFYGAEPIGIAQLKKIDSENLNASWGFYIGERDYRGRGISKKILFELLRVFFEDMKFKTLQTEVLEDNKVAFSLYKKFMFREVSKDENKGIKIANMEFDSSDWKRNRGKIQSEFI